MSRFGGRAQDDDPEQIVSTTFVPKPGAPEFCFEPSRKQSDLGCFKIDLPRFPLPTLDALHRYLAGAYGYEVRVFGMPPDVNDPTAHVMQEDAARGLYRESPPQTAHGEPPLGPKVPAAQGSTTLRTTKLKASTTYA